MKKNETFVVSKKAKAFAYCFLSMAVAHFIVSCDLPLWLTALAYGNEIVAIFRALKYA